MPATPRLSLVVLISGNGSNLQAIIDAIQSGRLNAGIRAVVSNQPNAFGLERARRANIPTASLDHRQFPDRAAFDKALVEVIDRYQPDLVVLAGFMRLLAPAFVAHYAGRLINIHPSLLPLYRGLDTHRRALQAGDTKHGASVHFVSTDVDSGAVIAQVRLEILPGDTVETLTARVLHHEHYLYPEVIGWFAAGRIKLEGGQIMLDGKPLSSPVILTIPAG